MRLLFVRICSNSHFSPGPDQETMYEQEKDLGSQYTTSILGIAALATSISLSRAIIAAWQKHLLQNSASKKRKNI